MYSVKMLFVPCTILFVATNALSDTSSFVPDAEFSLYDTTNGLELSFEYYFAATTTSNDLQPGASGKAFIKCPVIMCQPVCMVADDAYAALVDETQTDMNPLGLGLVGEITFKRPIGPFHSATIKMFTHPIPLLNHNFFAGGQIESIVSTSIVHRTTFDVCKAELINVRKAFERWKVEFGMAAVKSSEEYGFETRNPTWGGWSVSLSVRRLSGNAFMYTMVLRRKSPKKSSLADVQVDVDI